MMKNNKPNWDKHLYTIIEMVINALGDFIFSLLKRKRHNRVTYSIKKKGSSSGRIKYIDITDVKAKEITPDFVLNKVKSIPEIYELKILAITPIKKEKK